MATTMAADDDDKEVDGDGTRRSFRGGTIKASTSRTMAKATTMADGYDDDAESSCVGTEGASK
jgi:hypothetical protein